MKRNLSGLEEAVRIVMAAIFAAVGAMSIVGIILGNWGGHVFTCIGGFLTTWVIIKHW